MRQSGDNKFCQESSSREFIANQQHLWIVLTVVLAGFLLRIYRIEHQSVWFDEAFSLTVSRLSLGEITDQLIRDFVHPPLHYYMLHFWFQLVGFGAFQARLLSAIFGSLAIAMIYVLARYLFDRQTAILSALLLAVSQLGVLYSQEARPYSLLLFLVLSSTYLFVVALKERRGLAWWGSISSATLMIYTHYYGALVVLSLVGYAVLYRKRYPIPLRWLIGGSILFLALYVPWMMSGVIEQALHSKKALPGGQPSWFTAHWFSILSAVNQFNNGKFFGRWISLVGIVFFTVPALVALKPVMKISRAGSAGRFDQESLVLVSILWLLPVSFVVGLGVIANAQYDVRYVAFCAAPYYILVAHGITKLNFPRLRPFVVVAVLIYSVFALRANYFIPYKENYRDALAYLAGHYREGDYCVFLPFHEIPLQWSIYNGNHPGLKIANIDAVASNPNGFNRIWVVTYGRIAWAVRKGEEGRRRLEATHSLIDERHYFWVDVYLYTTKRQLSFTGNHEALPSSTGGAYLWHFLPTSVARKRNRFAM